MTFCRSKIGPKIRRANSHHLLSSHYFVLSEQSHQKNCRRIMKHSTALLSLLLLQVSNTAHAIGVRGSTGSKNVFLEERCTATVRVADSGQGQPHATTLDCETPSGKFYTVPSVDENWVKEKMASGILHSGVTEIDTNGATFDDNGNLVLPHGGPPGLVNKPNRALRKLAVTTGDRSVLVVRVVATDGATTSNEATLSNKVFGTSGDPVNLKSQTLACSKDKLNFVTAANMNKVAGGANSTNISVGVTTVNVAVSTTQGDATMRNEITSALNTQFGVASPSSLANHVMYCLPAGTLSGIAYAYINSWMSVYSNQWCNYVSAQMHELGHNLALAHSSEGDVTYEDQTGMMGFSYSSDNGPTMFFNGAKFWQLGWLAVDDKLEVDYTYVVNNPGSITLDAFINTDEATTPFDGNPQVIKINSNTATDLYVVFNRAAAHNSGTREAADRVTIVEQAGEESSYAESSLVAKLDAGQSYQNAGFFDGLDLTVDVVSVDTINNVAVITITAAPECVIDADCDDASARNGAETCAAGRCTAGTPVDCSGSFSQCGKQKVCSEPTGTCEDDGDGTDGFCDILAGETCQTCGSDCMASFTSSVCGDGICGAEEDCNSCAQDCAGRTGGKPKDRFCCSGGPGGICSHSECGNCSDAAIATLTSCCGDGNCEGNEAVTCPSDCPATPSPTPAPTDAVPPGPSCPVCGATGLACCGTCVNNGNPANRGCFPPRASS